jgi:murein DD-endopeptidase MepM/ murein hydrolase activator NlpD
MALIFIVLVLLVYIGAKIYNKKRYGGVGWVEYQVQVGDDLAQLAAKFNVKWKVLAKTNKLAAPYLLEVGKIILVPAGKDSSNSGPKGCKAKLRCLWNKIARKKEAEEIKETTPKAEAKKMVAPVEVVAAVPEKKKRGRKAKVVVEPTPVVKKAVRGGKNKKDEMVLGLFGKTVEKKETIESPVVATEKEAPAKSKLLIVLTVILVFSIGALVMVLVKVKSIKKYAADPKPVLTVSKKQANNKIAPVEVASQPVSAVAPENVVVKVVNVGAPAGTAGNIKDLLASSGFAKTEAKNGDGNNLTGVTVVYNGGSFRDSANKIKEILAVRKIVAEVREAVTDAEKDGDVAVFMGK